MASFLVGLSEELRTVVGRHCVPMLILARVDQLAVIGAIPVADRRPVGVGAQQPQREQAALQQRQVTSFCAITSEHQQPSAP